MHPVWVDARPAGADGASRSVAEAEPVGLSRGINGRSVPRVDRVADVPMTRWARRRSASRGAATGPFTRRRRCSIQAVEESGLILVICPTHKKAWFLCRYSENDAEIAGMDGHFNAQPDVRWEMECAPRLVALGGRPEVEGNEPDHPGHS